MADSIDIQVAKAVLAELNAAEAGTFSKDFTAERIYLALMDLADLAGVRVSIVPGDIDSARADRRNTENEVGVRIGVRAKLASNPSEAAARLAELDGLRTLTDELRRYFEHPDRRRLSTLPAARFLRIENRPAFVPTHLAELQQYTSILSLTYRMETAP